MEGVEKINESGRLWLSFDLRDFIRRLKASAESEKGGELDRLLTLPDLKEGDSWA